MLWAKEAPHVRSPAAVAIVDSEGARFVRSSGDRFDVPEHSGAYQAVGLADTPIETVVVNPAIEAAEVTRISREEMSEWLAKAGPFSFASTKNEVVETASASGGDIAYILIWVVAALVLLETVAQRFFSRGAIRRQSNPGLGVSRSSVGGGGLEPTI